VPEHFVPTYLRELITVELAMSIENLDDFKVIKKNLIAFILVIFFFDKSWDVKVMRARHVKLECSNDIIKLFFLL